MQVINSWEEFEELVKQWAKDRNILSADSTDQALKGLSECGELADNLAKKNFEAIKDDIGDNCVVAVIVNEINKKVAGWGFGVSTTPKKLVGEIAFEWFWSTKATDQPNNVPYIAKKLAYALELDFYECLTKAWNDIKDRKGILYNGVFVKETDERYNAIKAELGL